MIEAVSQDIFHLRTRSSSYLIHILGSGQAEHVYYGHALRDVPSSSTAMMEKRYVRPGMEASVSPDYPSLVLDDTLLEASAEGLGDYKIPFLTVEKVGRRNTDFRFVEGRKYSALVPMASGLPQTKDNKGEAETLELVFKDQGLSLEMKLIYTVFPSLDAITRRTVVTNRGEETIDLTALASAQLDFRSEDMKITTFTGTWGREFEKTVKELKGQGTLLSESRKLFSSAEANPGFLIEDKDYGAYACNLLYSGPHRMTASLSEHGLTHIVWGMNPSLFSWDLIKDESFESPEAVMVWGDDIECASSRMREFVAAAVSRSRWQNRLAPLMLSTWDSLGYDLSEDKVLQLARKARDLGLEGIIIDDGWFGARENESTSLGDWSTNTLKFPSGLYETAKDIHKLGLLFGLWFEPESVSRQSELMRKHPEWCIGELLDFSNDDVVDYMVSTLRQAIERCPVDYLRWDLNKINPGLVSGTFAHKYILGVYRALSELGGLFPDLYIETSAGGAGRFDLGMLCFSTSIALSRNNDPAETVRMFSNASMLYPPSAIGTVVTGQPSRITGRKSSLETCFDVSAFGALSYSLDLSKFSRPELKFLKEQVDFYKSARLTFQFGVFSLEEDGNRTIWTASRQDGAIILVLYFQKLSKANTSAERLRVKAADPASDYLVHPRSRLLEAREKPSVIVESTSYKIPGDALRWAGISLPEQISGNGYTHGLRALGDFSSRLYIVRRVENE